MNIQVESTDKQNTPFAFGLGISSLQVYTTDEKWEKRYLDRTDPVNKNLPMRKCATLAGFCLYFLLSSEIIPPEAIEKGTIGGGKIANKENYILKPSIDFLCDGGMKNMRKP